MFDIEPMSKTTYNTPVKFTLTWRLKQARSQKMSVGAAKHFGSPPPNRKCRQNHFDDFFLKLIQQISRPRGPVGWPGLPRPPLRYVSVLK